jgi:hypothetical protein
MRHRRRIWLLRLVRPTRRRKVSARPVLDAAAAWQEAERRAARARILEMATTELPTVPRLVPPQTPLLTPGQAARANSPGS